MGTWNAGRLVQASRRFALWLPLTLACDPLGGVADAADGALPEEKRYIDGPGERLKAGPWNRVILDLDSDTLYHVGARRLGDDTPTFHLFGAEAEESCQVSPNAVTFLTRKPEAAPYRVLPYLESLDERGRGTLRFTTVDCEVQDLVLEDASPPWSLGGPSSFLVPVDDGLWKVDPWTGETSALVERLEAPSFFYSSSGLVLRGDGKLKSFDRDLNQISETGQGIITVLSQSHGFVTEDETGLHRVKLDPNSGALHSEDILPGGCGLQTFPYPSARNWFALHLPCESETVSIARFIAAATDPEGAEEVQHRELSVRADARHARVDSHATDPRSVSGESLFYLTDVSPDGTGTLWLAERDVKPLQIGARGNLLEAYLTEKAEAWEGTALVDVELVSGQLTARWVRFYPDGTLKTLAENRLLRTLTGVGYEINFDGVSVDLVNVASGELVPYAENVPIYGARTDALPTYPYAARLEHFDGVSGQLRLGSTQEVGWQDLGSRVAPGDFRFSWFMPALFFIENFDTEAQTGTLVAYNFELGARSTVAKGVSSFDLTEYPWPGVVYTVPYGKERGIWFAKAK